MNRPGTHVLALTISAALLISCRSTTPELSSLRVSQGTGDHPGRIQVSEDGRRFVRAGSDAPFIVWGVNYDHDHAGRLIEEYWDDEWPTIEEDFREIRALGANVVRIHLQLSAFMKSADQPNESALARLADLVALAENTGLYFDVTGLGCYRKTAVPEWYRTMGESERWAVQARFWKAVAKVCAPSDAIFCYDLMNEPVLPGGSQRETKWLAGEFGDMSFVQRISLDLAGRGRERVAQTWVGTLAAAIRSQDRSHMITVGVIPWAMTWPGAQPIFYAGSVSKNLDFVSVHVYPRDGEVDKALAALKVYDFGKPLVVEEMFPLRCSSEDLLNFVDRSRSVAEGWISFYWGRGIDEYTPEDGIAGAIQKHWLECFHAKTPDVLGPASRLTQPDDKTAAAMPNR